MPILLNTLVPAAATPVAATAAEWTAALWVVLAVFLGLPAGFFAMYERFGPYMLALWRSWPAVWYLVVRAVLPGVLFLVLWSNRLLPWTPAYLAIACGIGMETVLRLQLFVKQGADGQDVNVGIADFYKKIERFFFDQIAEQLARRQQALAERVAPTGVPLDRLIELVRVRIQLTDEAKRAALLEAVASVEATFANEPDRLQPRQDSYARMLAIALAPLVSEAELGRLLAGGGVSS